MAERAVRGDYLDNAEMLEQRRRSDVGMNTEVRRVDESAPKSQTSRERTQRRGVRWLPDRYRSAVTLR